MPTDNPFQPPKTEVLDHLSAPGKAAAEPRKCPAGQGWAWVIEGFGLFSRAPLIWMVIIVIFGVISVLLSLVPLVSLLNFPLSILFAGGLMLGCDALDRGEDLTVGHLFAGFSTQAASLVGLGALYLGAAVLISMILGGVGWMFEDRIGVFMAQLQQGVINPVSLQQIIVIISGLLLLGMLLFSPVLMAVWFAPALIVLQRKPTLEAATLSLQACMKNWLPFLVYGLLATLLLLMAMVPLGLGLLIVVPALTASVYASYKDIFIQADKAGVMQ